MLDRVDRHRHRLQLLVNEAGSQGKLAEVVGTAQNYISQLLNTRRGIARKFCERLERKTNKPDGWMDQWLPEELGQTAVDRRLSADEAALLDGFRSLDDTSRVRLLGWVATESSARGRASQGDSLSTRIHEKPPTY